MRQAIPGSYVSIHVSSTFDISVYIDVNGKWVSGDSKSKIQWSFNDLNATKKHESIKTWSVKRIDEQVFTEINDRAEWGTLHLTGPDSASYGSGPASRLRTEFAKDHSLHDHVDEEFRSISDDEPVFAFAYRFSMAKKAEDETTRPASANALFSLLHVRDPVVKYAAARGLTNMRPLWKSWLHDDHELIAFHYSDYEKASGLAKTYSDRLAVDAYKSGSDDYKDIVALSARQTLGATDFSGTAEQPLIFLKEISSNGNSQTVDVIFPAIPFFLYTNPSWLAYLVEPLLEHMLSGQYPHKYSMHDLGTHYPNLTGHADGRDEYMPVEECGNMLIMGLSLVNSLRYGREHVDLIDDVEPIMPAEQHASSSWPSERAIALLEHSDGSSHSQDGLELARKWLSGTYPLWKQWTGYLVEFALEPHTQLSTDDFAGWLALHSNLALKGIVGIKAMSELALVMNESEDARYYQNISEVYIQRWEELAVSRDGTHVKLAYDWYGSWTTVYSLFADTLLCFHRGENDSKTAGMEHAVDDQQAILTSANHSSKTKKKSDLIPDHIYQMQSNWYHEVMQKYGLPLDSRHLYTKSDWEFEAAAVAGPRTRKEILGAVAKWLNETNVQRPLTDWYKTEGDGGSPEPNFYARPVVGGHFAFLALERECGGHAMDGLHDLA